MQVACLKRCESDLQDIRRLSSRSIKELKNFEATKDLEAKTRGTRVKCWRYEV
jgi:hypothetical protein